MTSRRQQVVRTDAAPAGPVRDLPVVGGGLPPAITFNGIADLGPGDSPEPPCPDVCWKSPSIGSLIEPVPINQGYGFQFNASCDVLATLSASSATESGDTDEGRIGQVGTFVGIEHSGYTINDFSFGSRFAGPFTLSAFVTPDYPYAYIGMTVSMYLRVDYGGGDAGEPRTWAWLYQNLGDHMHRFYWQYTLQLLERTEEIDISCGGSE